MTDSIMSDGPVAQELARLRQRIDNLGRQLSLAEGRVVEQETRIACLEGALREISGGDNAHTLACAYLNGGMTPSGKNAMPCDCVCGKARKALSGSANG